MIGKYSCKLKNLPGFILTKVGLDEFWVNFEACTGNFYEKKPKKSGQKPGFENQKWAEKMEGVFSKRHFLGYFRPFFDRFAQI